MNEDDHILEYRGFRAIFDYEPTQEHLRKTRELIDRNWDNLRFEADFPLDQWPEDPSLPDPMGQAVWILPIARADDG